ncbi:MAG: substrate-binding domain-containing protein [Planctomycetales bacterium]
MSRTGRAGSNPASAIGSRRRMHLWATVGIEPKAAWYLVAGTGMGQTLRMASEKRAYTLADRGTFLAQRPGLDVVVVCEGDKLLRNDYTVIRVNPAKHPHVRHDAARRFADFLTSEEARSAIGRFGVERFGQPLFFPDSKPEPTARQPA